MGELKKIRVRRAKPSDHGLFKKLWLKLLKQQSLEGSIVEISEKTLNFYVNLFNIYLSGQLSGLVLFIADKGVLMWGDNRSLLEYPGKLIMNWGVYADAEFEFCKKMEDALYKEAENWAVEKAFTGILMESYKDSKVLDGFELASAIMYKDFSGGKN